MDLTVTMVRAGDEPLLAAFLAGNPWPFHQTARPSVESIQARLASGWLEQAGTETFWILSGDTRCGLLRLFDLADGAPLFDLRLRELSRGQGLGFWAVQWLMNYVFGQFRATNRIEATTRVDNVPMRRALEAAGWVKESHWRRAWETDGTLHDGVGYGVLRSDFDSGTVTPVR